MKKTVLLLLSVCLFLFGSVTVLAGDGMMDSRKPLSPYDYTIAVVGDTQWVTFDRPDHLHCIYDYLVENAEKQNIRFVCGLGDITHENTADEWNAAKEAIHRLDGVLPYSLVRGNHDGNTQMNITFPYKDYASAMGGSANNRVTNSWQTFEVYGLKYLVLSLDMGPADALLDWAGQVIEDHPEHNVIITTHAYIGREGQLLTDGAITDYGGSNDADAMWDKLISQYSNIVLVLCGHVDYDRVVISTRQGAAGNTVTQMLVNPQGVDPRYEECAGLVALLHFSNGGKTVEVEYYSTIQEKWFMEENQFTFELNVIGQADLPRMPAYGDVTGDDAIDAKDALLILQTAVDKAELTPEQTAAANVNGDDAIDAKDALLVLQKAVDKIDKFPVEQ